MAIESKHEGSDKGSKKLQASDHISEAEAIGETEQNKQFNQIKEEQDENFSSMTDYVSAGEKASESFQLVDDGDTIAESKNKQKSNDENLGSYAEGLKAITPEEQVKYSIDYINQKAEKLGYGKVKVETNNQSATKPLEKEELKTTTFAQLSAPDIRPIDPKIEVQKIDDQENSVAYRQDELIEFPPEGYDKPVNGREYNIWDILIMDTPIADAIRSKKSPTLNNLVDRMKGCPWAPRIVFQHPIPEDHAEYNPDDSSIYIDPTKPVEDQIRSFAHESYHSTHQNITKFFSGPKPVQGDSYNNDRLGAEFSSFRAEIKVHNELKLKGHVVFKYLDKNNDVKRAFLEEMLSEDQKNGTNKLDEFLRDITGVEGRPYHVQYRRKAEWYADENNYKRAVKKMKPMMKAIKQWEARLKD